MCGDTLKASASTASSSRHIPFISRQRIKKVNIFLLLAKNRFANFPPNMYFLLLSAQDNLKRCFAAFASQPLAAVPPE